VPHRAAVAGRSFVHASPFASERRQHFGNPADVEACESSEDVYGSIERDTAGSAIVEAIMDASRFDHVARVLARGFPRRGFLHPVGAGGAIAALGLSTGARSTAARTSAVTAVTGSCPCDCFSTDACWDTCLLTSGGTWTCAEGCRKCKSVAGVAGGGTVGLAAGEGILVVGVSAALDEAGEPTDRGVGLVRWTDPTWGEAGLTLESVGIGRYGPVGDLKGVREMDGLALVNGDGPYFFVLRVTDTGPDGRDTVTIAIGDQAVEGGGDSGLTYGAEGPLLAGDIVGTWTLPELPDSALPPT
jgi:hypothetical protein